MARKKSSSKARKVTGFSNVASSIAKRQGIPVKRARAILAATSRKASPAAKRRNPALKRVKGAAKTKKRSK